MSAVREKAADWHKSPQERFAAAIEAPLMRLEGKGVLLAARVVDLETGQEWYSRNPDTAVIPASNGKLAISAAGLDTFGPSHTFKTYLVREGSDLWIIGTGDPALGDPKIAESYGRTPTSVFDDWADALVRRGVKEIPGRLMYWDGAFDEQLVHPNWNRDFLVDWYAAPVSGLNFNDNCIDVTAYPTEAGQPARLEIVPPASPAYELVNQSVTNGEGEPAIERAPAAPSFTVKGGIKEKTSLESKPITDPGRFLAESFRSHLARRGIEVRGETVRATTLPFGATGPMYDRIVAIHESSMRDVLNRINKNSQNLFAEAMSKSLGREMMYRRGESEPGSWSRGEEATKLFLWRNRINPGQYVAVDGSGLARENRVTARLITDLLLVMDKHPAGQMWRESLAIGGRDGTIAKRMKDIEGKVQAKTGYIGGVRALSGYVTTKRGKRLAFSFIYNNIKGTVKPYEELQDDACRVMYYWPGKAVFPEQAKAAATQPGEPTTQPADAAVVIPVTQPTTQP